MITEGGGGSQLDPDLHLPTGKIQTEREQREGQELHHQQAENRAVGAAPLSWAGRWFGAVQTTGSCVFLRCPPFNMPGLWEC